jgi:hypothetical protein
VKIKGKTNCIASKAIPNIQESGTEGEWQKKLQSPWIEKARKEKEK